MKDLLFPLRVMHGRLHEWRLQLQDRLRRARVLLLPLGRKYYVLGTPTHTNIGDSAIVLAERAFLERYACSADRIKELTVGEVKERTEAIIWCLKKAKRSTICWHGGGNMGDQWFQEEAFRRKLIAELPDRNTVVFPQTIFYTDTERGKREEAASIPVYNGRSSMTLVAREQTSYQKMKEIYPDTKILLTPDIVLSCTMKDFGVSPEERKGALLCARSDAEKSIQDNVWEELIKELESAGEAVRRTDMYSAESVTKENRAERVREKMQEFCSAKLVITDRLHGMVFAAITGTPCIVFSNYNHKVKGTFDWISYLPYIRYVETEDEAKQVIPELLKMKNCRFDNSPLKPYFDQLAEVVKKTCR